MRKPCPYCESGWVEDLDGDGYFSQVICDICNGLGYVETPDSERNIKEE